MTRASKVSDASRRALASEGRGGRGRRRTLLFSSAFLPTLLLSRPPARASIPLRIEELGQGDPAQRFRQRKLGNLAEGNTEAATSRAYELFLEARSSVASGEYSKALTRYDDVVRMTSADSALAEYARLGRAITRYEVGDKKRSVIELEYEVLSNVGIPEAHAALASAWWASGKATLAENQWEIAMEFDKRFSDIAWVRIRYHWGPQLTSALESFLNLST